MKDDDEEEENTFGVVRYPCMPSLVALQQMRNRLHLAFLGRKLMKWTALATGKELRRLSAELYEAYEGFGEEMRNAFILLARSRFYYPQLNHIVTEDVARKAAVLVHQTSKPVSSVKIVQFDIIETEYPPYEHLGIDKGGQTITATKKAWLELLKKIIMMMQLRASFLTVEMANKNATKKMNVLKKIVIPRTNVTIGYILTELEEMAREEFHRLKKVKEKKKRDTDLKNKKREPTSGTPFGNPCEVCDLNIDKFKEMNNLAIKSIVQKEETPTLIGLKSQSSSQSENKPTFDAEQMKELYMSSSITSARKLLTSDASTSNRLDNLKRNLKDLIVYSKALLQSGTENFDINKFLKMCDETKLKLDQYFKVDEQHQEIKSLIKKIKEERDITTSMEDVLKPCENTKDVKINVNDKKIASTSEKNYSGLMFECGQSCITKRDSNSDLLYENQKHMNREALLVEEAPCDLCILDIKEPSEESICNVCSNPIDEKQKTNETIPITTSDQTISSTYNRLKEKESTSQSVVAENLGYFEKKKQKKIKVTRRQNMDGTVWEEKETITIRKVKHDPTKTSLLDDEDDNSDENLNVGNSQHINICTMPRGNRNGFTRDLKSSQSVVGLKNYLLLGPRLRQCISLGNVLEKP